LFTLGIVLAKASYGWREMQTTCHGFNSPRQRCHPMPVLWLVKVKPSR
jgi:hypothetical protein